MIKHIEWEGKQRQDRSETTNKDNDRATIGINMHSDNNDGKHLICTNKWGTAQKPSVK